jgi:paraquat-inducible protein A
MHAKALIVCEDCDLLQRETPLRPRGSARCVRCGAQLYRNHLDESDQALPYTLGAIVLFVISNSFPIIGLQLKGDVVQTTLFGGIRRLYEQGMEPVAALVFVTMIVAPLAQLAGLAYLLLPLKFRRVPPWMGPVFRLLTLAQAWSMVEVFFLGVLVALVKLSHLASVVPGIALWSFAGLMLLLAAANAAFDPRAFWARAGAQR